MANNETAVEMFVGGLVLDPHSQHPVVVLKDESGDMCLPIWIGVAEATSIASAIKNLNMPRPLTHDLMTDIFQELGVKVQRIVITDLKESTYFAELILSIGEKALIIDSRPSDAIAIAVRAQAPIFVAQHVIDQAKMNVPPAPPLESAPEEPSAGKAEEGEASASEQPAGGGSDLSTVDKGKWKDILDDLDPDDFKYKM
ncbi:MAG: bifunctional nuclease family protein [Proteobacteria bacterium]|nr:bifunctional nuclease family protein [Pseudomonadota bacterium]